MVTVFLIASFGDFLSPRARMFYLYKGRNASVVKYYPPASYEERKKIDFKKKAHKTSGRGLNFFICCCFILLFLYCLILKDPYLFLGWGECNSLFQQEQDGPLVIPASDNILPLGQFFFFCCWVIFESVYYP